VRRFEGEKKNINLSEFKEVGDRINQEVVNL